MQGLGLGQIFGKDSPRTIWCIRGTLNYVCLAATVRLLAVEICDKTDIGISLIRLDVYDV